MGVAGQVLENMLGSAEGWFGIDDPFHGTQAPQQGVEQTWLSQVGGSAETTEFSFLISLLEGGQHLAAKQAAEYAHRQEETGSAVDPAGVIESEPTGGDEAMQVRMVAQVLAPGMEHGEHSDACTEMARICGDLQQGFGCGTKQQVVEQALVAECERCQLFWQGEDDMRIGHGQQAGRLSAEPAIAGRGLALGTMPVAAGEIADVLIRTGVAPLQVSAEGGGTA